MLLCEAMVSIDAPFSRAGIPRRPHHPRRTRAWTSTRPLTATLWVLLAAGWYCNKVTPADRAAAVGAGAVGIAFTDVTKPAGLGAFRHETGAFGNVWMPETFGSGAAFIDYDGDGWFDILAVGGGHWSGHAAEHVAAVRLFRNEGDGTFTDRTREAGLYPHVAYGFGLSVADYDNDGDSDVFLATIDRNRLFRNDGGSFTEISAAAGLADRSEWSTSALFFDADNDGWLDLYVGNYVRWTPETDIWCTVDGRHKAYCSPRDYLGVGGRFYRNNGDGSFSDRTEAAGFGQAPGKTLGVAELDFNDDGWSDLVVANDTQRNLLYVNNGDGTFTEKGVVSGIAFDENGKARAGMGIDAGHVDGSGRVTVVIGNFSNEMAGVYQHVGNGLFVDRAAALGIGMPSLPTLTFGVALYDVENDGDLDLWFANGHITEEVERLQDAITYRQPAQLFVNQGEGAFVPAVDAGGVLGQTFVGRGLAYADVDRDGDVDVLFTENGGPLRLWRNDLDPAGRSDAHYLRVRVEGRRASRDALGTRLVAVAGGRRQERRIRTGGSYLSQSETIATFGLGGARQVDTLYVYWPGGRKEVLTNIPAHREIRVIEGEGDVMPVTVEPIRLEE